ncbi:hypothetical protein JCM19238_575 [Vibrio ponticus]|nr:hypothetical protein JCM19238_575 [Vibrio ponticus]
MNKRKAGRPSSKTDARDKLIKLRVSYLPLWLMTKFLFV